MVKCRRSIAVILGFFFIIQSASAYNPDSLSGFWAHVDTLSGEEEVETLMVAKRQFQEQESWNIWLKVVFRLLDVYATQRSWQQSLSLALEVRELLPNDSTYHFWKAHAHLLEAEDHFFLQQRDSSIQHFQEALSYLQEADTPSLALRAALGLGSNYLRAGKFKRADTTLQQALSIAKGWDEAPAYYFAQIYSNLLYLNGIQGDYTQALEYALAALDYSRNNDEVAPKQLVYDLTNAGVLYRRFGDYDRAELYLRQALEIEKTFGEPEFSSYNNLGALHLSKGEHAESLPLLEQAVQIVRNQPADQRQATYVSAYQNLADAYLRLEKWDEIEALLDELLLLHKSDSNRIELTWLNFAKLNFAREKIPLATSYVERSLQRLDRLPGSDRVIHSELYRLKGELTLESDAELSLEMCQRAVDMLSLDSTSNEPGSVQETLNPHQLLSVLLIQGKAYEVLSQTRSDSINLLQQGLRTWQAVDTLLDYFLEFYPMEGSQYLLLKNVRPAYQSAIRLAFRLYQANVEPETYAELAYYFSEKSKSVILQARMREQTALQLDAIPQELKEKDRSLRNNMGFYRNLLFQEQQKTNPDTAKIQLWNQYLLDFQLDRDELLAHLQENYPTYYQFRFQNQPASFEELKQALVQEGSGAVIYTIGEYALFSWYLYQQKDELEVAFQRLAVDEIWKEDLSDFIRGMRDYDRILEFAGTRDFWKDFVDQSHHWYKELLHPVLSRGSHEQGELVIVPDGLLGYLPFELLIKQIPKSDLLAGEYAELDYVLRSWTVRYEYAASFLIPQLAPKHDSRELIAIAPEYIQKDESFLAVEGARGEETRLRSMEPQWWPPLGYNKKEANSITGIAKGISLIGAEAQEARFREIAHEYQVLHLAMHAFADDEAPLYSGLVFSQPDSIAQTDSIDDGILYAHELYQLPLTAELAVLSACNTGTGKLAEGEGILSLARAFKYAGVSNIVMSLWQADDRATSDIMTTFYKGLRNGTSKHEALREAKLQYLQNSKRAHPFFWATFVLYGDDQPVEIRRQYGWMFWLLVLSVLTIVGYAGYSWKKLS